MLSVLPFRLHFDGAGGFISQILEEKSKEALKAYYMKGGYASTPLGEGEYGKKQGEELFSLIKDCLSALDRRIEDLSFLEIGASYGYLLSLLEKAGAKDVVGIEPGDEGAIGSRKYGVRVIKDFFPSKNLTGKFDFIFSYAVLEHIDGPAAFIKAMSDRLEDGGIIFIGVPDCEMKMKLGDASIISHQHINYFTRDSFGKLMADCGLDDVHVASSGKRSLLTGFGIKKNNKPEGRIFQSNANSGQLLEDFRVNFKKNIDSLQSLVDKYETNGKNIGFYAPGQNIVGLLEMKRPPRIFDGDAFKTGKHINGCASAFESMKDLIERPVDVLFICSIDYDKEISEGLAGAGLGTSRTEIISLKKIYEDNSGVKYDIGSLKNVV